MPAKRKGEVLRRRYFNWLIYPRDGIWYADGRSGNSVKLGRYSLSREVKAEAIEELDRLDLVKAIEHGLAPREEWLKGKAVLSIADGRRLYEEYVNRPAVAGGVRKSTSRRYRAILDKFEIYCRERAVGHWSQVNKHVLLGYADWLKKHGYAYASQYIELTTLKQIVKWLIQEKHLEESCLIRLQLKKAGGTTTYCWREEEVAAILAHCESDERLKWIRDIVIFLAYTGLRISELISLRWSDIEPEHNIIRLTDEGESAKASGGREPRRTKSGRSRVLPIHAEVAVILAHLPRTKDGFIFHGRAGGRLKADKVRNVLIREVLEPMATRYPSSGAGKGFREGRLHSFRHFFCSICVNRGVPEQTVMNWLGHSDSKMVRHYYHLNDAEAQRQIVKLEIQWAARTDREAR